MGLGALCFVLRNSPEGSRLLILTKDVFFAFWATVKAAHVTTYVEWDIG